MVMFVCVCGYVCICVRGYVCMCVRGYVCMCARVTSEERNEKKVEGNQRYPVEVK